MPTLTISFYVDGNEVEVIEVEVPPGVSRLPAEVSG